MRFRIVFFLVVCSSSYLRTNAQLTQSQTDALTKLQGSKSSVECSAAETSSCTEAASKLMPLIMGDSPMLENLRRLTDRSEEHTSELQSHSFISYAVFCLKKKKKVIQTSCTRYLTPHCHVCYRRPTH